MADTGKQISTNGGGANLITDFKNLFSVLKTRKSTLFVYGLMFTFVTCTAFLAFSPSRNSSSPWFHNIFSTSSTTSEDSPNRSKSSFFPYLFPNSSQPTSQISQNITKSLNKTSNPTMDTSPSKELQSNQTVKGLVEQNRVSNFTTSTNSNHTLKGVAEQNRVSNFTDFINSTTTTTTTSNSKDQILKNKTMGFSNSLMKCDILDGKWVRDDLHPLYSPGSCPHIDESFNCYLNGRPDGDYQKLRWQPKGCNLPRLNGIEMLELLRGKRLVFVGDSLNRNMWESLVCILRNSLEDKSKVFEASGQHKFRTGRSCSFLFKDYNCTVEFFPSPFLVQEWEMPDTNGSKKETLRLDLVERSSSKYRTADIIIFNTGHWWTHEKTSKGKDYYQEGSHVYGQLKVLEAFRKALTTWARWVDANVNPDKTQVFFRGYSPSHFSGGQWNSGGQCDSETQPIKNETYLTKYPPKMGVLESVLKGMKMPVSYLNITRMTDYRKDAHPSIYRKQNYSEKEQKSPLRYQDCSHWCLPGVPDAWNELLYAQLLIKQKQQEQQMKRP